MLHAFPVPYAVLLALVALQRVVELAYSRRNLARVSLTQGARGAAALEAITAGRALDWASMIAVHALLILLPALEVAFFRRSPPAFVYIPAALLFFLAQVLRYWSIATLGREWNARAVVDPTGHLVTDGPYRWIRHPNYLAVLLEFSAVPLAGGAWISWLVLNALHAPVLARRIRAEEALLAAIPGYDVQMLSKHRFLPRWKRTRAGAPRSDAAPL